MAKLGRESELDWQACGSRDNFDTALYGPDSVLKDLRPRFSIFGCVKGQIAHLNNEAASLPYKAGLPLTAIINIHYNSTIFFYVIQYIFFCFWKIGVTWDRIIC